MPPFVEVGEGAEEAAEINAGFLMHVRTGRPLVHLKLATSLDGRIATASGDSKWITGEVSRETVRLLSQVANWREVIYITTVLGAVTTTVALR